MQDFRKLHVWHKSVDFAARIYLVTERFPTAEKYGLRAQMRSAAISVSSNIAEGCGRPGRGDMARFLGIAIGSVCEVESQLHVTRRLSFLEDSDVRDLLSDLVDLKRGLISLYGRVRTARAEIQDGFHREGEETYHLPPTT